MGAYSDDLEQSRYEIYPDDEDYMEKLCAVAEGFRSFDAALDSYLEERGLLPSGSQAGAEITAAARIPEEEGAAADAEMPDAAWKRERSIRVLRERFAAAGVPAPRNLRKWYSEHKRIERRTALQLCFALELDPEEAGDFLRRICLQQGVDFHDPSELIVYFCLKRRLPYREAEALQEQAAVWIRADGLQTGKAGKIDFAGEVYYTEPIRQEAEKLETSEELMHYIEENRERFRYNHATAARYIRELWGEIAGDSGLASRERKLLYHADRGRKQLSVWEIYLQILGLAKKAAALTDTDRSLKPLLKNNRLLHELAQESFPDRDGLTKILNGEHVSRERARKVLILLTFYRYWAELALHRADYRSEMSDGMDCELCMDHYLTDAGYPALYVGNPYDWIFLYMAVDDYPLLTFREWMREALPENCRE